MTTAEAIDSIPEIVAKAIPLVPYNDISCPAKRKVALDNANWRRAELTRKITSLIIQHSPLGIGIQIDMNEIIKNLPNELT